MIFVIEVVEVASLNYGNAKRREKAGRDSAPHRAGVFVGVHVTVSGVLKAGAEILSVAPGRHETEGCARDTRKRVDLTDRFFIEIENLLGRFAVSHRGNVNGEDVPGVETGLGGLQSEKSCNQSTRAGEKHERGGDLSNGKDALPPVGVARDADAAAGDVQAVGLIRRRQARDKGQNHRSDDG